MRKNVPALAKKTNTLAPQLNEKVRFLKRDIFIIGSLLRNSHKMNITNKNSETSSAERIIVESHPIF